MGAGKRLQQLNIRITSHKGIGTSQSESLPCIYCSAEDHLLCSNPDIDNQLCCCSTLTELETVPQISTGNIKGPDAITDVQSTGRKRAALLYPITEGMICEWAKLKYAGGGVVPIIGCLGNVATDRHHGPDKNTLNNREENVHRICSFCHNYWHARNDEFYGERPNGTEPFIPLDGHEWQLHNPNDEATIEEIVKAQIGRKQPKQKVGK